MNDPKLSRTGCAVDSPADPEAQPRDAAPVSPEQEPVSEQNLHAEVSSPPPLLPQQPRSNKWQWMLGILLVILGSERHVSRLFLGGHTYIAFAVVGILAGRAIDRWSLGGFRRWVYLLPATVLLPYVGLLIWGEQSGLGPYVRGMKALEEQHFERAIPLLNEAIRLKPDFTDAYFNRGLAYLENGQFDKAVADYTEVIRLRPEDSDAYFNLGIAYFNEGKFDKAIADYTEAIRLNPEHGAAYYNRGAAYQKSGNQTQAEADFAKAKQLGSFPE